MHWPKHPDRQQLHGWRTAFRDARRNVDYRDERDERDERNAIPTISRRWQPATELERFYLGTSDVNGYEGEDGDNKDTDVDEEEEASEADDGSTPNVEGWGHSRFDLWTSDVDGYECENGADADADEEEEASQADDGSKWNVEDWGHNTRECEDWTVYFRHVKYNNGEANATASDVSEAKTIVISDKISKLNINQSTTCGYQLKKDINIARRCVSGYSITAAPTKSVTHVLFWWCVYVTAFQTQSEGGDYATRPVAWTTGSM